VETEPLQRSLDALSRFLVGDATLFDTLTQVSSLTVDAIGPTNMVGLTLLVDGEVSTAVFTNSDAPEIDQTQYDTGSGPCVESFETGRVVAVTSTARDRRYPEFSRSCVEHGIASTLSLPLMVGDRTFGAMNMYATRPDAFSDDDEIAALRFATQASVVLANAQTFERSVTLADQLRTALTSRESFDLARGIIIGSTGCSADEAFQRLVDESQHTNVKLRDVAAGIVSRATRRSSDRAE
jgi:GAF domain-containing protein